MRSIVSVPAAAIALALALAPTLVRALARGREASLHLGLRLQFRPYHHHHLSLSLLSPLSPCGRTPSYPYVLLYFGPARFGRRADDARPEDLDFAAVAVIITFTSSPSVRLPSSWA